MNYRSISLIANEIRKDWGGKINYAAKPYLDAMMHLRTMDDRYGYDSAEDVISRFLSNASQWKGDTAKRIKAELNAMLKGKPYTNPIKESTTNLKKLIESIVDRKLKSRKLNESSNAERAIVKIIAPVEVHSIRIRKEANDGTTTLASVQFLVEAMERAIPKLKTVLNSMKY